MKEYSKSKFNMWRACIGVIWIDGKITKEEKEWILEKINILQLSQTERDVLKQDLDHGVNMEEVLELISDKRDRAFLCHQIRVIGHLDGDYSSSERALYQLWNDKILSSISLEEVEEAMKNISILNHKSTGRKNSFSYLFNLYLDFLDS